MGDGIAPFRGKWVVLPLYLPKLLPRTRDVWSNLADDGVIIGLKGEIMTPTMNLGFVG